MTNFEPFTPNAAVMQELSSYDDETHWEVNKTWTANEGSVCLVRCGSFPDHVSLYAVPEPHSLQVILEGMSPI